MINYAQIPTLLKTIQSLTNFESNRYINTIEAIDQIDCVRTEYLTK